MRNLPSLVLALYLALVALVAGSISTPSLAAAQELADAEARDGDSWLAPFPGAPDPLAPLDPDVPSPASVLGYAPGERFTPHHRILAVVDALAAASDRLRVETYGRTTEDRPLRLVIASSPANLARLDEILEARRRAFEESLGEKSLDAALEGLPAVVWAGFGVHGNESSSPEAAMAVLHLLAAAEDGSSVARWMDDLVVVIDPVSNPDGRERYVSWYRSVRGATPDADGRSLEHHEPWPGGRQNHYLFDLNRDWAWATQVETRARLAVFHRFAPDVHVDVHEMRPETTYFFPPAAEPVHPRIASTTLDWLDAFGRANARAFDERGWPYFVREVYDFLYPGYGDTYPSLAGAVGMTYEMAGSGRAGLVLDLDDGRRRTLAGRTARHTLAVVTTLATAAERHRDLARDSALRRREVGTPGTYLWRADQPEARALAELLARHGVVVERLGESRAIEVESIAPGGVVTRSFGAETFLARAEAPAGRLLHALMEREPGLSDAFVARQRQRLEDGLDAELYDVTAWALPFAYGVETWRTDASIRGLPLLTEETAGSVSSDRGSQGWLVAPQGLAGYRFVARLLADDVRMRRLAEPVATASGGEPGAARGGSVFVPRHGNPPDLDEKVARAAEASGARVGPVSSAWLADAPSLGSGRWRPAKRPRIGLVAGRGVDVTGHGHLWHLFDVQVGSPISRLDVDDLDEIALEDFDVLLLPDGRYASLDGERLGSWLRAGGTLVAVGDAVDWLRGRGLSSIEEIEEDETGDAEPSGRAIAVPGAVVATELSEAHPLAVSFRSPPPVLYRGTRVWRAADDPRTDVLVARREDPVLAGLVWPEAEERLGGALLVGTEDVGEGRIVAFAQDPVFRGFWRATLPLLLDAVFFGH